MHSDKQENRKEVREGAIRRPLRHRGVACGGIRPAGIVSSVTKVPVSPEAAPRKKERVSYRFRTRIAPRMPMIIIIGRARVGNSGVVTGGL